MATYTLVDWSELVADVLSLIYNRLSYADFARARTVCSSWYSVSRSTSPTKNRVPWLIFKQDRNWKLFNPEEGKSYITHISRLGFADCRSLATCGNWVLVTDKTYLYIINPFTLEIIIDLPPLKSHGKYKILNNCPIHFDYGSDKRRSKNCPIHFDYGSGQGRPVEVETSVLWVDERTKDYLVVWKSSRDRGLRFCKKGDEEWLETPSGYGSIDHMIYKDKKLYILSYRSITILDFSQDFPREVPNHPYVNRPRPFWFSTNRPDRTKMRLTTSGDVQIIRRVYTHGGNFKFNVYKMNSTNEEWEMVNSLDEDEKELLWDFCDYCHDSESFSLKASTYEILTQKIESFKDLRGVSDERWFFPCFGVAE